MQELSLKSGGGRNFGRGRNLGRARYTTATGDDIGPLLRHYNVYLCKLW